MSKIREKNKFGMILHPPERTRQPYKSFETFLQNDRNNLCIGNTPAKRSRDNPFTELKFDL